VARRSTALSPGVVWPDVLAGARLGVSTGYLRRLGSWEAVIAAAASRFPAAVELSALAGRELPDLLGFFDRHGGLEFGYVAMHAPAKDLPADEHDLIAQLLRVPSSVTAVVVHPDTMRSTPAYGALGARLVIENMDERKRTGRTPLQLEAFFDALPEAGFCLDVAHAASIDPTMDVAHDFLDAFHERLRHVHVSSLDASAHHVTLTTQDEERFAPVLERCRHVPWILEAEPPDRLRRTSSASATRPDRISASS
jgi:hypothetical protein